MKKIYFVKYDKDVHTMFFKELFYDNSGMMLIRYGYQDDYGRMRHPRSEFFPEDRLMMLVKWSIEEGYTQIGNYSGNLRG